MPNLPRLSASSLIGACALLAILIGSVALRPSPVQAAPSFDCFKANAPVEHLICNDPVLARYDEGLAEAFKERRAALPEAPAKALLDDQRKWLKDRLTTCAIPTTGAVPQGDARWPMVSCLVDQYEQRLAAFQALPADEPSLVGAEITGALTFVHPSCLLYASGVEMMEDNSLPPAPSRAACNQAFAHIPLQYSGEEGSDIGAEGMSEGFYTWSSTYTLGALPDGRTVVVLTYNGGGTGYFSNLLAYRIDAKGQVVVETAGIGGDRCNGGLNGGFIDGSTVTTSQSITPYDLAAIIGLDENSAEGLDYCAICCFGSLRSTITWPEGGETTITPTLFLLDGEALAESNPDQSPAQQCLLKALDRPYGEGNQPALTLDELKALKGQITTCVAQGGPTATAPATSSPLSKNHGTK